MTHEREGLPHGDVGTGAPVGGERDHGLDTGALDGHRRDGDLAVDHLVCAGGR